MKESPQVSRFLIWISPFLCPAVSNSQVSSFPTFEQTRTASPFIAEEHLDSHPWPDANPFTPTAAEIPPGLVLISTEDTALEPLANPDLLEDFSDLQDPSLDQNFYNTLEEGLLPLPYEPADSSVPAEPSDGFHYSLMTSASYDDNLFLSENNPVDDLKLLINPIVGWKNALPYTTRHWLSFTYSPTAQEYLDNSDLSAILQQGSAQYRLSMPRLIVDAKLSYLETSEADRFVGSFIDRSNVSLLSKATYAYSEKINVEGDLAYSRNTNGRFSDTTDYSFRISGLYRSSPKILLGPFIQIGQAEVQDSPDQLFIKTGARAIYDLSGKISVEAWGGIDHRTFSSGGLSVTEPSATLKAIYQQSEKIRHTLDVSYLLYSSFNISSAGYRAAALTYGVVYDYSDRIIFRGGIAYERDEYYTTSGSNSVEPEISFVAASLGYSYRFLENATTDLQYRFRTSDSSLIGGDFNNNEITLSLLYNF